MSVLLTIIDKLLALVELVFIVLTWALALSAFTSPAGTIAVLTNREADVFTIVWVTLAVIVALLLLAAVCHLVVLLIDRIGIAIEDKLMHMHGRSRPDSGITLIVSSWAKD